MTVTELKQACIDEIIDGNDPFAAFENRLTKELAN